MCVFGVSSKVFRIPIPSRFIFISFVFARSFVCAEITRKDKTHCFKCVSFILVLKF